MMGFACGFSEARTFCPGGASVVPWLCPDDRRFFLLLRPTKRQMPNSGGKYFAIMKKRVMIAIMK
jgi:hypothetical protein